VWMMLLMLLFLDLRLLKLLRGRALRGGQRIKAEGRRQRGGLGLWDWGLVVLFLVSVVSAAFILLHFFLFLDLVCFDLAIAILWVIHS
jgi:hypothetical protein